jgi:hypothetical protein
VGNVGNVGKVVRKVDCWVLEKEEILKMVSRILEKLKKKQVVNK